MPLGRCRLRGPPFVLRLVNDGGRSIMMSEFTATFDAGSESTGSRGTSCRKPPRRWSAHTVAVVARLREFAPYAAMELVLPGGSLLAFGLWLYRRQRTVSLLPRPWPTQSADPKARALRF